jgi:translation initiation factor 6
VIEKYDFKGSENLGFHAVVTNEYILAPQDFNRRDLFEGLEVIETKVAKTDLVGLFSAGNSNGIIVPREISDLEKSRIEDSEVDFKVIESRSNALGNLILCNDKGALISPKLEDFSEEISEALDVDVTVGKISGLNPGVSAVANSKGAVIHRDASEEDAEMVMEALDLEDIDIGTVNMGSPFVGSGATGNDEDLLTGENTTGPEIGRFDRTLF